MCFACPGTNLKPAQTYTCGDSRLRQYLEGMDAEDERSGRGQEEQREGGGDEGAEGTGPPARLLCNGLGLSLLQRLLLCASQNTEKQSAPIPNGWDRQST